MEQSCISVLRQPPCGTLASPPARLVLEKLRKLFRHRTAELFGIHDGDGAAIVARDVVADADGDEFDRRLRLDLFDHAPQVLFEIVARIDGEGRVVDRRAVRNHHQDAALFRAGEQAVMRPDERFAVDIFLQQPFAHHEAEIAPRAPPGAVGLLVDDVPEIVQAARLCGLSVGEPALARLSALPGAGGEAEDFDLHRATLQRAGENIGAHGRHRDRAAAH